MSCYPLPSLQCGQDRSVDDALAALVSLYIDIALMSPNAKWAFLCFPPILMTPFCRKVTCEQVSSLVVIVLGRYQELVLVLCDITFVSRRPFSGALLGCCSTDTCWHKEAWGSLSPHEVSVFRRFGSVSWHSVTYSTMVLNQGVIKYNGMELVIQTVCSNVYT